MDGDNTSTSAPTAPGIALPVRVNGSRIDDANGECLFVVKYPSDASMPFDEWRARHAALIDEIARALNAFPAAQALAEVAHTVSGLVSADTDTPRDARFMDNLSAQAKAALAAWEAAK